jgi:4-hydroxybenzoate polyprenyltransferase
VIGREFLAVAVVYFALQLAYSLKLKHMVILDVFSIATGFVLRAVAGAEAISVEISSWLLICTMLLSLFLALSKRRHELILLTSRAAEHRKILAEYSPALLDQMVSVVTSATVVSYALYTMSEETVRKFHTYRLIYTVPFVLYGVFRYLYLVYKKEEGGSPDTALFTDIPLLMCVILYVIAVWLILYQFA